MEAKNYRFETLQIHAGLQPDEATGARGVAIYPTAAYRFKSCDRAAVCKTPPRRLTNSA